MTKIIQKIPTQMNQSRKTQNNRRKKKWKKYIALRTQKKQDVLKLRMVKDVLEFDEMVIIAGIMEKKTTDDNKMRSQF